MSFDDYSVCASGGFGSGDRPYIPGEGIGLQWSGPDNRGGFESEVVEPPSEPPPAEHATDSGTPTAGLSPVNEQPRKLLTDWYAITSALNKKYEDRKEIRSLNKRFRGPIVNSGKGTRPMVYDDALREWWDRLTIQAEELANQREGKRLTVEAQYNYGKDGTVAPEIGGEVKKRRRDRKPA